MSQKKFAVSGDGLMLDYFMLYAHEAGARVFDQTSELVSAQKRERSLTAHLVGPEAAQAIGDTLGTMHVTVHFEVNGGMTMVSITDQHSMSMREFYGGTDSRDQDNGRQLASDLCY